MFPAYVAFSVLTKGYACGLGTTGYEAFALLSKGYVCFGAPEPVERVNGGDSSKRLKQMLDTSMEGLLLREDEEVMTIIMAINKRRH